MDGALRVPDEQEFHSGADVDQQVARALLKPLMGLLRTDPAHTGRGDRLLVGEWVFH